LPVLLPDGEQVEALAYVIDPDHVQYCGDLPLEEQAHIIAHAVGGRGPNSEYLFSTAEHLSHLNIDDSDLGWLAERVREIVRSQG
jgi:glutathione-specific gamma-glutamylcyclotransferase